MALTPSTTLRRAFAVFVALVCVAELSFLVLDSRLEAPLLWYSQMTQRKADEVARGVVEDADIVFIGSSMTDRDVDVVTFQELTGIEGWNGGIPGAQVSVLARWALEEVLDSSNPQVIVVGLSSLELNDARLDPTILHYDSQLQSRDGFYAEAERELMDISAFYRHRLLLREPIRLVQDIVGDPPQADEVQSDPLPAEGFRPGNVTRIRETVLNDFSLGGSETEALEELLAGLADENAQVVVVWMPVPSKYIDLHPRQTTDFDAARELAARIASDNDAVFMDLSREFEDSAFADLTHLSDTAAVEFTERLATELQAVNIVASPDE